MPDRKFDDALVIDVQCRGDRPRSPANLMLFRLYRRYVGLYPRCAEGGVPYISRDIQNDKTSYFKT